MEETWKPIPDFNDYEVSNLGNVRSYKTRKKANKRASSPKLLSPYISGGYKRVLLTGDDKPYLITVHKLVTLAFIGPCPEGMEVCHGKEGKLINSVSNLRYDTHKENIQDIKRTTGKFSFQKYDRDYIFSLAKEKYLSAKEIHRISEMTHTPSASVREILSSKGKKVRQNKLERNKEIKRLHFEQGLSQAEISQLFNLHYSAISYIVNDKRTK